jgi:hypothetical protein
MAFFNAKFLSQFKSDIFIETGTYKGQGIRRALDAGMGSVHSIEIDSKWLDILPDELKLDPRVSLHLGDSADVLHQVLLSLDLQVASLTIFLDAHVMTGQVTNANNPCPVLKELEILASHTNRATVLVDDMRIFATQRDSWNRISVDDVRSKVLEINDEYSIRFENDLLIATLLVP